MYISYDCLEQSTFGLKEKNNGELRLFSSGLLLVSWTKGSLDSRKIQSKPINWPVPDTNIGQLHCPTYGLMACAFSYNS